MIRLTFCVGLPPTSCWGMISRGAWTLCPGCCWGAPWRSAFTLISCTFPPVGNIVDGLPTIAGCTAPLITWLVVFPTVTTPRTKKERILYYLYLYDTPQQNNYLKHLAIFFFLHKSNHRAGILTHETSFLLCDWCKSKCCTHTGIPDD